MTKRQLAYREFLSTLRWSMLRDACFARDNHRCVRCQSKFRLQAHHHTYPPDWNDTRIEHLESLCQNCHRRQHGLPPLPVRLDIPRKGSKAAWRRQQEARKRMRSNWSC